MTTDSLLRLAARCPKCNAAPAHRITEEERARYLGLPPEKQLGTVQCQVRTCRQIYWLQARDYQKASFEG